jgi:hypothetical protein
VMENPKIYVHVQKQEGRLSYRGLGVARIIVSIVSMATG